MTGHELRIWAGGFFDGEGCVSIAKQTTKYSKGKRLSTNYCLGVSICQKEKHPLEIFHAFFGGHLYPYQVKGVTYYRWHTWSAGALQALRALQPYLILKQARCVIGIEFQENLTDWNQQYGRTGYPEYVNTAREQYFQSMKELNKRGITSTNPNPKTPGVKKGSTNYFSKSLKSHEKEITTSVQ